MNVGQYVMWIAVLLMSLWLVGCTSTGPSVSCSQTDPLFMPGQTYNPDDVLCMNEGGSLYFISATR